MALELTSEITRKATSTTLLSGLVLAGMLIEAGQYWPAVVVYGLYTVKEAARYVAALRGQS